MAEQTRGEERAASRSASWNRWPSVRSSSWPDFFPGGAGGDGGQVIEGRPGGPHSYPVGRRGV
ncbi:MAG TPA: hypothetical protein VF838_17620 [Trebonia sp.]